MSATAPAPLRRVWRLRRCPSCRATTPAGRLIQLDLGANWARSGQSRCRCPGCGWVGARAAFRVVSDLRREADAP